MNQAQLYSENNSLPKTDNTYVLDNYFRLVKWHGNDTVLDVGCGPGDVTMQLLLPRIPEDNIKSLTGIDVSEEMVRFANSNHKINDRVDFQVMDIASKDIPEKMEENFDHIFSFFCLHWVQEQKQAMENLYKMLKPGGDMLLTLLAGHPVFNIYERMVENPKWNRYMKNLKEYLTPYLHIVSPEAELETLLKQIGFETPVCKVIERNYTYSDMDDFMKFIVPINPFLASIPNNLHNDYFEDYRTVVEKLNFIERNDNNNSLLVPYKLLVVYATKGE